MWKNFFVTKAFFLFASFLFVATSSIGQTLPYKIENNSIYADDQVYVAVVGIKGGGHVWVNAVSGQVNHMSPSDNTVQGPVINGNKGPGDNALYANCFRKLSDIPNKTVTLPQIAGCRILISFKSPLYLYFFGFDGPVQGYAAPNLANSTDPNQGIKYEVIELTYDQYGLWCNTTRVDFFQYPMGVEVWGENNFYGKVGELKSRDEIINLWKETVPAPFQVCLDEEQKIIHFPSKRAAFPSDYFNGYIDAIWSKYRTDELVFISGDAGVWKGRVTGDVFKFNRESDGQVAYINGKPSQQEALEGSGYFASGGTFDLIVQAQLCAAINRHALDLTLGSGVPQDFGNTNLYYNTGPYNEYCNFFHNPEISYANKTYTFCYDDVFDQSATVHTPKPTSVKITIGGFVGSPGDDDGSEDGGDEGSGNDHSGSIFIEAEDYVVMSGVEVEDCFDINGGENVGWIDAGDWMVWDVNIPETALYEVFYRVASENSNGIIQLELAGGDHIYGSVNVPNTGGFQNWETISHFVTLNAGAQQIAISVPNGGYNLNWLEIVKVGSKVTSINKIENFKLQIYPNPAASFISVEGTDRDALISIYDMSGKKVIKTNLNQIDLSQLNNGIYLVESKINGKPVREKMVKK